MTIITEKPVHKNTGKIYKKSWYKQRVVKYTWIEPPVNERLERLSNQTWLSNSYIIAVAIVDYLDKMWVK